MEALGRYMTSKTPPTSADLGSIISVRELLDLIGERISVLTVSPACVLTDTDVKWVPLTCIFYKNRGPLLNN
jgi:hypothetical protein